ncbi:phage antirepressor KilAC domain-containing protein [Streptobacillus moniliformis]|uniref:phage antirepressor KilAC domain-containing protein n=1 Tax=Streptobacillus moniliformis TaxID=34105 RepID=UPI0007E3250B|nr:phage antirepressor KilAC domain-containing protein [Streptobacillus moniliformis]
MELALNDKKENITSLELLEKINQFREQVEGKAELLHKDLLKIVRDEFEEEINERKISPVKYKDKKGEERPMFILTFSQAKQVLVRESKKVRKMVIEYIEKLENALKNQYQVPNNFREALQLALKQQEEIEVLTLTNKVQEQQIQELQPKATYYDLILQCKDLYSISSIAEDYGKTAQWLNTFLVDKKVQYKHSKNSPYLLYREYKALGYTSTKTINYSDNRGEQHGRIHTYWTQKGRLFLYDLLKQEGILPTIERENNNGQNQ